MYKNVFLKAYAVPRGDSFLVITRDSCFKISGRTHALLAKLPAAGEQRDYMESLAALGAGDPGAIFKKLVEMKCLAWSDGRTKAAAILREIFNPVIELLPARFQERAFPFLRPGQFQPSSLFKFSLYGALFGLALSVALPFWEGFLPYTGAEGAGGGWVIIALVILSVLFHELGHSSFAHLNGIGFRPIGFSMYLFFPVFYANISGVSQLDLKPKLSINLGGLALQGIFLGLLAAGYLLSGRNSLFAAMQCVSYLIIFNMNPLINTDTYWCYQDTVAAFKGNRLADLVDKLYSLLSLLFTGYLVYVGYLLVSSVTSFAVRALDGNWSRGGAAGAALNAYMVIIMARGIFARFKALVKTEPAAA